MSQKPTKAEKVTAWMKKKEIGGSKPWFDPNTTYYELTVKQIISISDYLKRNNQ